jgi:hypothetical protein
MARQQSAAAERYFAAALEALAGAEVVEPAEPDSPPLADFDSDFDSVFDSVLAPESALVSAPVFFSAGADSEAEPPPDSALELPLPEELLFAA